MTTLLLLVTIFVLAGICVALAVVLLEAKAATLGIVERWREALASRLELRNTHAKLRSAEKQLAAAKSGVLPLVERMIEEQHRDVCAEIAPSNRHQLVHEFGEFLAFLEAQGAPVTADRRRALFLEIELAFERARRIAEEKARQAELKAQIREEEKIQRDAERAIREAEREAALKRAALEEAIRRLGGAHSEQVEKLRRELAEAQAKAERTKSMAEQTRAGHVYIISNIGSFGKGVFKVGLTRRLDPLERVDELGDASVPFSFDVHALISSRDAPALEAKLHQELEAYRVNRVNLRKEFFRIDLETIIRSVKKHHGVVEYEADAKALEFIESLQIEQEARGEIASIEQIEGGEINRAAAQVSAQPPEG